MDLQALLRRHRNAVLFAALIMLVAGLDLLLNSPEPGRFEILSLPFVVGAAFLLAVLFWPAPGTVETKVVEETLGHRLLNKATLGGRLVPYFPLAGIVLIALDVVYNVYLSPTSMLQIHDTVAILFAISLVAYPFVPQRFDRERDFVLLFFFVLVLMLVVPLLIVRVYEGNIDTGVNAYSSALLAPELRAILSLFGISTTQFTDPDFGAPGLSFTTQGGDSVSVVITTSCSGIYSFSIFAAAFTAFILTEFNRTNWRVWLLLVLGFVAAYLANLLRMTVIVATGYFSNTSDQALSSMLIAHSNAGWLIFLGWITLFWLLMFRFLFPRKEPAKSAKTKTVAMCGICGEPLSPTIPGVRCECGSLYHSSCAQESGICPACNRVVFGKETQKAHTTQGQ